MDVGARVEIYRLLREVAGRRAVVVQSSDALELHGLCDRVHVFSNGAIVKTLEGDAITEGDITGAAIGAATARQTAAEAVRSGTARLRRFLSGDYAPILILAALILALGIYTTGFNPNFLSERNINGSLFLASALAFVSSAS